MPETTDKGKHSAKSPKGQSDKTSRPSGSKSNQKKSNDPPKDRNYFLKYPQSIWYEQAKELPALDSKDQLEDENKILLIKQEAKELYEKLSEDFEDSTSTCALSLLLHAAQSSTSCTRA